MCREVKLIVDIICMREARGELQDIKNMNNGKNLIPIIPKNLDELSLIKNLSQPIIFNEYAYKCGFFGWCNICRKTANHYSIDFRLPVCFFNCRDIIFKEESKFKIIRNNLIKDYPDMFNYFCKILSDKESSKTLKIYILEILTEAFNNYALKYNFIFQLSQICLNANKAFSNLNSFVSVSLIQILSFKISYQFSHLIK